MVAKNRNLDVAKVKKLADGSTMLGQMALENGLIDEIGDQYDVENYLSELIGEKVNICW
jgi:protease-4